MLAIATDGLFVPTIVTVDVPVSLGGAPPPVPDPPIVHPIEPTIVISSDDDS